MARSKYNAVSVDYDGIHFDSTAEQFRYAQLRQLEASGEIVDLRVHMPYVLWEGVVDGKREVIHYEADFVYHEGGRVVAEDVKGVVTDIFKIKYKMFRARYPEITFRIVDKYGREKGLNGKAKGA